MKSFQELLDTLLGQLRDANPTIPQNTFEAIKGRITDRIRNEPSPQIAFIGDTGVGKSSTLNALFNAGQEVGHEKATTQIEAGIEITTEKVHGEKGSLIVYDMPGLGESLAKRDMHLATYERVLSKVDVALWIIDAQYWAMEYIQRYLINEISQMNPGLVNRMVFALNKVDLMYPGELAWHPLANLPSPEQQQHIQRRIAEVRHLILEALPQWQGTIIGYSATKRYNLPQLFSAMLDAVAKKRQWVISKQMALANYYELVDASYLPDEKKPLAAVKRIQQGANEPPSAEQALMNMSEEEFQELVRKRQNSREQGE